MTEPEGTPGTKKCTKAEAAAKGDNHPAETTGGAVAALKGFSHYI